MEAAEYIGHVLDGKYRIESELGRGGMGTVYLATHVGTERPVAVKIISPQYMKRPEFVERFRREARAAGRLRHPNVVNVTDFGFAAETTGAVAYLVMEYLDGCTLGEILEEENRLPVGWTLDILEQVCSAVHEAHEQGIIHRDLKPDNIWLEPNQRGGYTVKVLDFGIAKLESADGGRMVLPEDVAHVPGRATMAGAAYSDTIADAVSPTLVSESKTLLQTPKSGTAVIGGSTGMAPAAGSEDETALFSAVGTDDNDANAVSKDEATDFADPVATSPEHTGGPDQTRDLTRVGSVLGTPLYMSPEQCRGEKLDARSDIYSLGVIAYQMLSGDTPFRGDFTEVMAAHQNVDPPPLTGKKVRRKLKRVIGSALAKDPDDRPQTAEAFASQLRARHEGIVGLLRRAGMIYTEHMPKFIMLAAFFALPMIVLTMSLMVLSFLKASEAISSGAANVLMGINASLLSVVSAFSAYLTVGTITWIVSQSLAIPLRPIRLRASLREAKKKWRTFAGTGILSTLLTLALAVVVGGSVFGFLAAMWSVARPSSLSTEFGLIGAGIAAVTIGGATFFTIGILWMLVGPVVMMENVRGRAALRRSQELVRRSFLTSAAAFLIMFLIPTIAAGGMSFIVSTTAQSLGVTNKVEIVTDDPNSEKPAAEPDPAKEREGVSINFGNNRRIKFNNSDKDMRSRLTDTFLETLLQIFLLPIQIVVTSFTAIIVALLYLKTRQAGGESRQDLLAKFEESDQPRRKWQERVRQRLIQSGRITSRS